MSTKTKSRTGRRTAAAGALVASLIPGGALVRGLVWIATGAAVLSAGRDGKQESSGE